MPNKLPYPRRPVRAAWLTFLGCSAWVTVFLPFATEELPPATWPFGYGYCALLAVATVGLIRLSRTAFLVLGPMAAIAVISGAVGLKLVLKPTPSDAGMVWLRVSQCLFYVACGLGIVFVIRGWVLYYQKPDDEPLA